MIMKVPCASNIVRLLIFTMIPSCFLPSSARADWMDWGLESICQPDKNRMVILPNAIWNREADQSDKNCVFSNGRKVLARVGYGSVRPYGMGGADPDKWISVWVDEKKIVHKQQYDCGDEGVCNRYFIVTDKGVERCTLDSNDNTLDKNIEFYDDPKRKCTVTLNTVFPEKTDRLEYPKEGDPVPPEPGSIVVEFAKDNKFCSLFLSDRFHFHSEGFPATPKDIKLIKFHYDVLYGTVGMRVSYSYFDADNDGEPEHVYRYTEGTNYRDADIYFIFEDGKQPASESVINDFNVLLSSDNRVFPGKNIDDGYYELKHWPKKSFVEVKGFGARYLHSGPFIYQEKTYFSTYSMEEALMNINTVLMLNNDGTTTDMCYFRRVSNHY